MSLVPMTSIQRRSHYQGLRPWRRYKASKKNGGKVSWGSTDGRQHTFPDLTSLIPPSSQAVHLEKAGRANSHLPDSGIPDGHPGSSLSFSCAVSEMWEVCPWRGNSEKTSLVAIAQVCGFLHNTSRTCTMRERATQRKMLVCTTIPGSLHVS